VERPPRQDRLLNHHLVDGTILATSSDANEGVGEEYFSFATSCKVQVWVLYDDAYRNHMPSWLRSHHSIEAAAKVTSADGTLRSFSAYLLRPQCEMLESISMTQNRFGCDSTPETSGSTYWVVVQELVSLSDRMDYAPHTVRADLPIFRAHSMFHRLGLRHLPVVDKKYHPVGVLTRISFLDELSSAASCVSGNTDVNNESYARFADENLLKSYAADLEPRFA